MEVKCRPVGGAHTCTAFTLSARRLPHKDAVASSDGSLYFVKGMPELILGECQTHTAADGSAVPLTEVGKSRALAQTRRMAACGLRVLALAYGPSMDLLTFAGVVGLEDPPREGVVESVARLKQGGIKVLMVTGDAKETALAIARRCGIVAGGGAGAAAAVAESDLALLPRRRPSPLEDSSEEEYLDLDAMSAHSVEDDLEYGQHALSGEQLDAIGPHNLADSIVGIKVFYRVAPRHKLALVRALQQRSEVVAMTGDGVNDATALKVSGDILLFALIFILQSSHSFSLCCTTTIPGGRCKLVIACLLPFPLVFLPLFLIYCPVIGDTDWHSHGQR